MNIYLRYHCFPKSCLSLKQWLLNFRGRDNSVFQSKFKAKFNIYGFQVWLSEILFEILPYRLFEPNDADLSAEIIVKQLANAVTPAMGNTQWMIRDKTQNQPLYV